MSETESASEARTSRRGLYVLLGVVAALLVAVLVTLIVILNQMQAAESQRQFEACMGREGFAVDEQAPMISDEDEANVYIEALADAVSRCRD